MSGSPVNEAPAAVAAFEGWSRERLAEVESALERWVPREAPGGLGEAMRYGVLDGGKRLRPLLAMAAAQAVGAMSDPARREAALRAACAVELIHAYSLIHDDMPCMDDDVLRRGKPTVHVAYGEATAMLVGDALQALAFEALATAQAHGVAAPAVVGMVGRLARASGSLGMAGGQAIDLAAVGVDLDAAALRGMHERKTGALLAASVALGAACGRVTDADRDQLEAYARAIGLAFQVVDDILDVVGDAASLGKTAGKDADHGKPTYVSVLGLERSRVLAAELLAQAREAVAALGPGARRLGDIAELIVTRHS